MDDSSFPESFSAIEVALGSLAEDLTNTSKADHLYCSASHLIDTVAIVSITIELKTPNTIESYKYI